MFLVNSSTQLNFEFLYNFLLITNKFWRHFYLHIACRFGVLAAHKRNAVFSSLKKFHTFFDVIPCVMRNEMKKMWDTVYFPETVGNLTCFMSNQNGM